MVASKIANFLNPRPKMPALILNPRRKIKSNNICCLSVFYLLTSLGDQKSSIIAPHQREARSGWTETDCKSRQAAANERPRLVQSWQSDQWEPCRDLFQITVGWGGSQWRQPARIIPPLCCPPPPPDLHVKCTTFAWHIAPSVPVSLNQIFKRFGEILVSKTRSSLHWVTNIYGYSYSGYIFAIIINFKA